MRQKQVESLAVVIVCIVAFIIVMGLAVWWNVTHVCVRTREYMCSSRTCVDWDKRTGNCNEWHERQDTCTECAQWEKR